jgi:hypothetical protein
MPLGIEAVLCSHVPEGRPTIARGFNRGFRPEGTRLGETVEVSLGKNIPLKPRRLNRLFETEISLSPHPTLKRWAIFGCPSGTWLHGPHCQILVALGGTPALPPYHPIN